MPKSTTSRRQWAIATLLVLAGVALLFLQAPHSGAFYWSDAPRHALNGVFVMDLLRDLPLDDPAGYAYRYYAQYPALTILFYPPLFYAISAPFFALFGVSHETALLVVALHYAAYGLGCWRLARYWFDQAGALAFAGLMLVLPEVAFWGRQVMLEVPAFAFLVWSAVAFVAHWRSGRPVLLYAAAVLLVLAMYTKISVVFAGVAYAVLLAQRHGLGLLRWRHAWLVAGLSALALVPLAVLTLKFGQANVQSVSGVADAVASRASMAGWVWYGRQLPGQLGWPLALLAAAGAVWAALVLWQRRWRQPDQAQRQGLWFWGLWFGLGYLFYSLIDLKEARHSVFILPALVFLAVWAVLAWLPRVAANAALAVLVLVTAAITALWRPVFYVDGYARVVDEVARRAPPDSVVLFSGYRDGSFTFNLRTREDRRDLSVLRADKILLSLAVRRELGVQDKGLSESEIAQIINASGVHYVVMQPGFWTDLQAMRRFEAVLASDQFEEVARVPTPANHRAHETELVIYRNKGPVAPKPDKLNIELKIIGRTITVQ
jgi:4-amino-4-deoxy-L-arabinose transferase-like glycosyltransferase